MRFFKLIIVNLSFFANSAFAMPNPAAVNCLLLNGVLSEEGMCTVDAWHLFREMNSRGLVKPIVLDPEIVDMPNPAAMNCENIKGGYTDDGQCMIEQWDLFRAINIFSEPRPS